jgi:CHAD domain-containing protein
VSGVVFCFAPQSLKERAYRLRDAAAAHGIRSADGLCVARYDRGPNEPTSMAIDSDQLVKPAKKLRKMVGNLSRHPAPGDVHKLRTAARRFEAINEVLPPGDRGGKALMKDVRRCRKRAGKVRDMDVLTRLAAKVHPAGEEECAVQLLEHLGAQRQKYAKRLSAEVRRHRSEMRNGLRDTAEAVAKRIQANGKTSDDSAVGPSAAATATSLAEKLAQPDHFTRENLHPYRVTVKKLRDVLKIASGDTRFSDELARVKDAIDEWHDWEELVSIAQEELEHGTSCRLQTELRRISRNKFDHALAVAQKMRRTYFSPSLPETPRRRTSHRSKTSSSAAPTGAPRAPVWDAIAKLTS